MDPFNGMLRWGDAAGHAGLLNLDRSQCIKLGSELIKLGNRLMRPSGLEVPEGAEQELILPGA